MKRRIQLVLLLMVACTAGVVGLQLAWSYQSYRSASQEFTRDINEALQAAAKQEQNARRRELLQQYRGWLADTSLVTITCRLDPLYKDTRFFLADKHPWAAEKREPFTIGFDHFTQKLPAITPAARAYFIRHFTEDLVWKNLQEGSLYFYTRKLGDNLEAAYAQNQVNPQRLRRFYRQQLRQRDISTAFDLILGKQAKNGKAEALPYATRAYNVSLRKPTLPVLAYFPDPNLVFLQRMKWILGSSLLLVGVALFCFHYTLRTLFRQKKLAELKDDFVNNMTHELKTPVATISLAAEAMQEFDLNQASTDEYLGIIRQQSGRLSALIDQILRSVALEQENLTLDKQPVHLGLLVEQVLAQVKPQLDAAGAKVVFAHAGPEAIVLADGLHLANVLATLLDNSLKYRQDNRGLVLRLETHTLADSAQLQVSDNGLGIAEEYQGRVFEKFFRVPLGNVHSVKGYGLGLNYAKNMVEQHGGTIKLHSNMGQGTTVQLTFPLAAYASTAPSFA